MKSQYSMKERINRKKVIDQCLSNRTSKNKDRKQEKKIQTLLHNIYIRLMHEIVKCYIFGYSAHILDHISLLHLCVMRITSSIFFCLEHFFLFFFYVHSMCIEVYFRFSLFHRIIFNVALCLVQSYQCYRSSSSSRFLPLVIRTRSTVLMLHLLLYFFFFLSFYFFVGLVSILYTPLLNF